MPVDESFVIQVVLADAVVVDGLATAEEGHIRGEFNVPDDLDGLLPRIVVHAEGDLYVLENVPSGEAQDGEQVAVGAYASEVDACRICDFDVFEVDAVVERAEEDLGVVVAKSVLNFAEVEFEVL